MVRHLADSVLRTAAAAPLLWETQGRWTEGLDAGATTARCSMKKTPSVRHLGADLPAPNRCTGDMIPSMRERQTYATTTILDAWGLEWACSTCGLCYHAELVTVARPGGTHLSPGGRAFAQ